MIVLTNSKNNKVRLDETKVICYYTETNPTWANSNDSPGTWISLLGPTSVLVRETIEEVDIIMGFTPPKK